MLYERFGRRSSISPIQGRMPSSPDSQLVVKIDRVIEIFAAWALLELFLQEHPPTKQLSPAWQTKWIGVLRQSESWMIAQFLVRRACTTKVPMRLCELAKLLVGRDVDRHRAARDCLRNRILPAFEAYELAQVTWVVDCSRGGRDYGHFEIAATEKLVAFLRDRYLPATESTVDEWLDAAAKEGDPSNEV